MINTYQNRTTANIIAIDIGKEARRHARNTATKPGATRKIEDKRRKPPKHRKLEAE